MATVRRDVFGPGGVIGFSGTEISYRTPEEGERLLSQLVDEGTVDPRDAQPLWAVIGGPNMADQTMVSLIRWSAGSFWRETVVSLAARVVLALTPESERHSTGR